MTITEIRRFPKTLSREQALTDLGNGTTGWHESILRSYHVLNNVRDLLRRGTPADVVEELIEEMLS